MNEKLKIANELEKSIQELKNFLYVVTKFDEKSTAIPSVNVLFTTKIKVECSLIGTRSFGCGTHEQTIKVPNELRNCLIEFCEIRLNELNKKLSEIIH